MLLGETKILEIGEGNDLDYVIPDYPAILLGLIKLSVSVEVYLYASRPDPEYIKKGTLPLYWKPEYFRYFFIIIFKSNISPPLGKYTNCVF